MLKGFKTRGKEKQNLILAIEEYLLTVCDAERIYLPCVYPYNVFADKVGEENNNLMYRFTDRGGRDLVLAPEYTSVLNQTANQYPSDYLCYYVAECFRGEKPQRGRQRQFTQIGVEWLNPKGEERYIIEVLEGCLSQIFDSYEIRDCDRGLDYYTGKTFEAYIPNEKLAIAGGGKYDNGIGFAIGIDRILDLTI